MTLEELEQEYQRTIPRSKPKPKPSYTPTGTVARFEPGKTYLVDKGDGTAEYQTVGADGRLVPAERR